MRNTAQYALGNLDAANEYTTFILSQDYRNATFTIIADNSANCTIKFYGSNSDAGTRPTFASAASATNEYSTVEVVGIEDGIGIDGDTGVSFAGSSDGVYRYEINDNNNTRLGVKMTARAAGDVTIKVDLSDNS